MAEGRPEPRTDAGERGSAGTPMKNHLRWSGQRTAWRIGCFFQYQLDYRFGQLVFETDDKPVDTPPIFWISKIVRINVFSHYQRVESCYKSGALLVVTWLFHWPPHTGARPPFWDKSSIQMYLTPYFGWWVVPHVSVEYPPKWAKLIQPTNSLQKLINGQNETGIDSELS